MPTFTYRELTFATTTSPDARVAALNRHGLEGWELVERRLDSTGKQWVYLLCKRGEEKA